MPAALKPSNPKPSVPGPDLRLLPAAIAAWAVTWWATAQRPGPVLIIAAITVVTLVALLGILISAGAGETGSRSESRRLERTAAVTLVLAVVAAVLSITGIRLLDRQRDPLTSAAGSNVTSMFTGRVMDDPRPLLTPSASGDERWSVRIAVAQLRVRGRTVRSSAQLVVLAGSPWGDVVAGSTIRGTGRLVPGRRSDPEAAVVFPRGPPHLVNSGSWIWRSAEVLRVGLRKACRGLPADARGLLPALVVGDTSRLSPQLKSDLQASGLTHLTSVSGENVAILAAVVVALISVLGGGLRIRVAGTALAIIGFVVLARPEPSVLRAAVMGGLALVGLLLGRRGGGMPLLAATSVVLIFVDPWLSRSFGFILSVLATAGLLLLVPVWLERLDRWPRPIVIAVAVPVAAQLVTAPVTVLLNPTISLVAVPANLLVEAAVGPATVAGVVAAALSPCWPFGARLVAFGGGLATEWIAIVAHRAAALPAGSLAWPGGVGGALLLAGTTVICIVLAQRRAWLALALSLLAVLGCLTAPRWVSLLTGDGGWPPPDWVVVQCDVGQGSSTLIRSGPDRAVIIDTGPDPKLVDACLRRTHVHTLDLVVITHFHVDHAGGITGALKGRGHPPIIVSPFDQPVDQTRAVTAAAASIGRRPVVATAGMSGQSGVGAWAVRWRLFPPDRAHLPAAGSSRAREADGTEINNSSVVVFAQVQGLRVMALGDVEPEAQQPLIRTIMDSTVAPTTGPVLAPVDVVIVAHHGSARQVPQLYELLRPRVALIGVGLHNDYGHPAPSTITLMRQVGALALRTDLQGQLAVTGPAGRLRAVTSK